ncbi:MAG: hypothetical protein G01um1014106_738, partial [Parcubacteria group bacterium Gr01-1014_106]
MPDRALSVSAARCSAAVYAPDGRCAEPETRERTLPA